MFEGSVTMHDEGWEPWVRALAPQRFRRCRGGGFEVAVAGLDYVDRDLDVEYAADCLRRERAFGVNLAKEGRGMVYLIGQL